MIPGKLSVERLLSFCQFDRMQDKKILKLKWRYLTMYELSNRDLDGIDIELGRYRTIANKIYLRRQELIHNKKHGNETYIRSQGKKVSSPTEDTIIRIEEDLTLRYLEGFYPLFVYRPPTWKKFPSPVPKVFKKFFSTWGESISFQFYKSFSDYFSSTIYITSSFI